ncbi:cell wall-binding repeat-containing protein [Clostridium sp. AWRP]|uniref:cell wall-binding repeat-containing protein n=1 Tax=Clostridium sp. AWRP TaxID=2212991 RepID=UPI000FDBAEBF|nr:cell wall-binding repeat-containing protein [Clostridium sp. AWRP]AZV55502.1 cell wall-binding repeat-containing protein [Clostridium sp. AWRP]
MKKILGIAATAAIVLGMSNTTYAKTTYNVTRLAGSNRYETSEKIADNFENGTVQSVIVASGKDFPDALGGSVLSKIYNAPILLLNDDFKNSSNAVDYIQNHLSKSGNIYILGGTSSVSDDFVSYIKGLGYGNVTRFGGNNRFETNKSIINSMNVQKGTPMVITNGWGFADALSVSSAAACYKYPIFMIDNGKLSESNKDVISSIQPSKILIIGGQGSVSDSVVNEIKSMDSSLTDSNITRLGGQTRYDTSLSICKYFNSNSNFAVLANGANFPDALAGSALASKLSAPIMLTNGKDISEQKSYIDEKGYKDIFLLGGLSSVDLSVEYLLKPTSSIPKSEIDYITALKGYCESYKDKTGTVSTQMEDVYNKTTDIRTAITSASTAQELSSDIEQLITLFNQGNSYLSSYKNDLTALKDEVSNLSVPNGLASLNKQYLDNINTQLNYVNITMNYTTSCLNVFTEMKDALDNMDIDKLEKSTNALQVMGNSGGYISNIENGNKGIDDLDTMLGNALNSYQHQ